LKSTVRDEAIGEFVDRLKDSIPGRMVNVYLFGSVTKGTAKPESDVDILVVYRDASSDLVLDVVCEIAFDIALERGILIQPVLMTADEFDQQVGRSPFLWEVLTAGYPIYSSGESTEWKLDFKEYLRLAEEYLSYAIDARNEGRTRLAIDAGYNAIELLVKALIIKKGVSLASSHSGVVQQFGELYVKTGEIERDLGKTIHKSLALRGQARYVPSAQLKNEDAELVIDTARKMIEIGRKGL